MPLAMVRCDAGHESEHLVGILTGTVEHLPCLVCGEPAKRIPTAPNVPRSGTYSYGREAA